MQLGLTIVDQAAPGRPRSADCLVDAPTGTTLAEVHRSLLQTVGRHQGAIFHEAAELAGDARLGAPPLLQGAILTIDQPRVVQQRGLLECHVTAGPDAGAVHRLGAGEHTIGRVAHATVRLEDPDVSRLHAAIRLSGRGATIRDLDSTNGTRVDGVPLGRGETAVRPGQVVAVGGSRLTLIVPRHEPAASRGDEEGHLQVNRPPRLLPAAHRRSLTLPTPPAAAPPPRFPWITLLVPVFAGVGLVALTRSTTFLLFVLLSPLMAIGQFASDRATARRASRCERDRYDTELAELLVAMADALARESRERDGRHPGAPTLLVTASTPGPRLWERRPGDPDALELRVGLADLPAEIMLRRADGTLDPATEARATEASSARHGRNAEVSPPVLPLLRDAPATVALAEVGVLGLCGPRPTALGAVRFWICQLATWHSPRHLGLVVLLGDATRAEDWSWVRWLAHLHPEQGMGAGLQVGVGPDAAATLVGQLLAMIDQRARRAAGADPLRGQPRDRSVIVIIDGAHCLRTVPGVSILLALGPAMGIRIICLEGEPTALPAECRATVAATGRAGETATLTVRREGAETLHDVGVDGVAESWARRLVRALAPLRDATPGDEVDELPAETGLLSLLAGDLDPTDPTSLASSWQTRPPEIAVPLGMTSGGETLTIDLAADGPHALVAGTTGSGKSELLQTLVAALAVRNPPDQLVFVLIDYKGGTAFADAAMLPHTVGLVTDLDDHLTRRALTSLRAELRRRERLLRDAGCADLTAYRRSPAGAEHALARLVIVVDEFATMAEELPDFLGGLVGVAQRGRSLGVHLVLATQRPAGVVSADIRANTSLRIALRVTDVAESTEVVDSPLAAAIGRSTPGRAVLRVGPGPVRLFQSARITGTSAGTRRVPSVGVVHWPPSRAPVPPTGGAEGPTDLARLAAATGTAARALGIIAPSSPWLPPLPEVLTLDDLASADLACADLAAGRQDGGEPAASGLDGVPRRAAQGEPPVPADRAVPAGWAVPDSWAAPDAWAVPLGRCDLPGQQRQVTYSLDLEHGGHLIVVGSPRTGRTSLLRTLAGSIASRHSARDVHLYGLDGSAGALGVLTSLPHCGVVVPRDQPARGDRLLTRLVDELDRRTELLARTGHTSLAEHRQDVAPQERLPYVVLLVDGWEGVSTTYDALDHGRPLESLRRLVREGAAVGFRVVATGDRGLLTSRVAESVTERLVLRLADPGDFALAGLAARDVPSRMPPGRGVLPAGSGGMSSGADPDGPATSLDAVEVQLALLSRDPGGSAQVAALRRAGAAARLRGERAGAQAGFTGAAPRCQRPMRIEPLPPRVTLAELAATTSTLQAPQEASWPDQGRSPGWTLLGVGGDELAPVGIDLSPGAGAFTVAGQPGSGRSTTLITIARGLLGWPTGPVRTVIVAPRRSIVRNLTDHSAVLAVLAADHPGATHLHDLLAEPSEIVVLADDAEALHDSPVEPLLLAALRGETRAEATLVLAGAANDLGAFFRGLTVEARRSRRGLLLGPLTPLDGDLLSVRLGRSEHGDPGRGVLVDRGRTTMVQVAVDDPATQGSAPRR